MPLSDSKLGKFIQTTGILSISFQLAFIFFYQDFPIACQVSLISVIPFLISSVILSSYKKLHKISAYVYLGSLFIYQSFTFIILSNGSETDVGSAFMIGSLSILASVIIGRRAGLILTAITIIIVLADLYLLHENLNYKHLIVNPGMYNLLSIVHPGIIVNYLSKHFYHTLIQEKKDKNELKRRLATVLDNSLQTIVLLDKNRKILYADVKSKEFAKKHLNLNLKDGDESLDYIVPEYRESFLENFSKAFSGEKITQERKIEFGENKIVWFLVMYSPLYDSEGIINAVQFSLIDISTQKNIQVELEKAEERWKYALTSSQDGVWDWSVKDGKAFFSKMYKEMLGYREWEIKDSWEEWENLIHPEDRQKAFEEVLKHVKNQSENYVLEHRLKTKSGEYKWILARGKIIERDEKGSPVRFIGTHTDIDQIKNVEKALKAAQEKAQMAAEAKSRFLSTISHEIRTPLNAVIGFSNLLLRENADTKNQEFLQNIQISANHLLSLVNNVLDISRIESGKIDFEKREFDLNKLLDENITMLSLRAVEKGISLSVKKSLVLSHYLIGDAFRLTQILNNLLGNAVKFTDRGHVNLNTTLMFEDQKEVEILFEIIDTGPGIAKDKQQVIFDSFTQASTETARKYGGTGLGLSISKYLINLQGGSIGVNSEVGQGAKFYFNLKFLKGSIIDNSVKISSNGYEDSLEGLNILVAEDNLFNTKVLTKFLELWKADFEVAENGIAVINHLEKRSFDLILMDLHMPGMDGYQATEIIRKSGNKMIIIALTASTNFNSADEIKSKGFDGYFYKPVNMKELFTRLLVIKNNKLKLTSDFGD